MRALDEACHRVHRASLFAASHLSWMEATCRLAVGRDGLGGYLLNDLPEAVQQADHSVCLD